MLCNKKILFEKIELQNFISKGILKNNYLKEKNIFELIFSCLSLYKFGKNIEDILYNINIKNNFKNKYLKDNKNILKIEILFKFIRYYISSKIKYVEIFFEILDIHSLLNFIFSQKIFSPYFSIFNYTNTFYIQNNLNNKIENNYSFLYYYLFDITSNILSFLSNKGILNIGFGYKNENNLNCFFCKKDATNIIQINNKIMCYYCYLINYKKKLLL